MESFLFRIKGTPKEEDWLQRKLFSKVFIEDILEDKIILSLEVEKKSVFSNLLINEPYALEMENQTLKYFKLKSFEISNIVKNSYKLILHMNLL